MELYSFYQVAFLLIYPLLKNAQYTPIVAVGIGFAIFCVLFLMQAFALRRMAINRGLKKRFMAFIPFVNILYIGKLAGECSFFGNKVKRAGLYVMLAQIVGTLSTVLLIVMEGYLLIEYGAPNEFGSWTGLTGFAGKVATAYDYSVYTLSILQLIYEIFLVVLMMGLYRKYVPKNYVALSFLTLFVPISRYIIILAIRKRKAIDYDAYIRAQREAYARRQQQYYNQRQNPYGNPYGNPYNNPYGNPYGNSYGQQTQKPKNEEPFEEFSSVDNTSSGTNGEDDFFN